MDRKILIDETVKNLNLLSDLRLEEVSNYIIFLSEQIDRKKLTKEIMNLSSESNSFEFLNDEENLYEESDLIEKYS